MRFSTWLKDIAMRHKDLGGGIFQKSCNVYFYELMSQRLFDFNTVEINHRPCFPFYASNGYALFLPDVRYTIGEPGYSATKCVVPGVQKLIDMGVADPRAIALHPRDPARGLCIHRCQRS